MDDKTLLSCENGVIGAIFIDNDCIDKIAQIIKADDFESSTCAKVFGDIVSRWQNGEKVDPVLVADKYDPAMKKFIAECMEQAAIGDNAELYAKTVRERSVKRQIQEVADEISVGGDPQVCATKILELSQELFTNEIIKGDKWANDFLATLAKNVADPDSAYCKTGFSQLDNLLGGGLVKGGLYILGARPGMGKTTVALNIAENVVNRGAKVLFISLEMSSHQIMCKRVSLDCNIPYKKILTGRVTDEDYQSVVEAVERLRQKKFATNATFSMTVQDIMMMAKKERDCDLLVVDYFGLINSPESGKGGSRYEIYSDISRQLKQTAGILNIPVLCLAQLNREVEKGRKDKRPILSDLRDTGSLEQDADSVIFLHRDGYYEENKEVKDEDIEVIVKKNRHGDCGTVKMYWYGEYGQICAYDNYHYDDREDFI